LTSLTVAASLSTIPVQAPAWKKYGNSASGSAFVFNNAYGVHGLLNDRRKHRNFRGRACNSAS
jgi:hypothetical protein